MSSYIKTLAEARELLNKAQSFNAGSLTATAEETRTRCEYKVYSYGTKIAEAVWDGDEGDWQFFIEPNAYTHSKTTSKHANIVKRAWALEEVNA